MTTVVLSPASRPSSPPTTASAAKKSSVLVSVAVAPSSESAKSAAVDFTDSTKERAPLVPEGDEAEGENVERRANGGDALSAGEEDTRDPEAAKRLSPLRTAESATETTRSNKKRPRVVFESADIVEFEPTIFTTTVTSGGIPLGMSLNERSRSRRRLDSFEMERQTLRVERQNYMEEGYLDPQEREQILNNAGCEEPTMATVEAEVNTIIQHRRESNEMDFEFMYGLGDIEEDDVEDVEEDAEDAEDAEDVEEEDAETDGLGIAMEEEEAEGEEQGEDEDESSENESLEEQQLTASPPPSEVDGSTSDGATEAMTA